MGKHAYTGIDAIDFTDAYGQSIYDSNIRTGQTSGFAERRAAPAHADQYAYTKRDKPGKHASQFDSQADRTYLNPHTYKYTIDPGINHGYTTALYPRHGGKRHAASDRL